MVPYAMRHYDRERRNPFPRCLVYAVGQVWSMPGKVLEAKTFVSVLLFVSVHFLYSWLLPAVQGSKEAKGGIVKDYLVFIY